MNLITVLLKVSPHVVQFHFDKYADAEKVLNKYGALFNEATSLLSIDDDYGSKAIINSHDIAGMFLTDLEREMKAHADVEIEKHRKDIRVGKKMQSEQNSGLALPRAAMINN